MSTSSGEPDQMECGGATPVADDGVGEGIENAIHFVCLYFGFYVMLSHTFRQHF